jgi:PAS domain S-box-containing protein
MNEPQNLSASEGVEPNPPSVLHEAHETVEAIRNGEVDAFVMKAGDGPQVFVAQGAYRPYRVFVEQMKEGAVTLSPDGIVLYANQAFADLIKTPLAQVIGMPIDQFVCSTSLLQRVLEQTETRNVEMELRASDRLAVPVYVSHSAVRSRETTWICLIVIDLSEQKRQQSMLQQQHRLAAIGMTAAVMSHEIANPLTAISAVVQIMQRRVAQSAPVASFAEDLRMIEAEIARLAGLLDDFRSLTQPSHLNLAPINIGGLVADTINIIAAEAAAAAIDLNSEVSPELPLLTADREKLKQAILNLCKNAIEAMPGGGKLTIKTDRDQDEIIITVTDTGMGIPEDVDIFELFTTTKPKGTGLGLAIVRQIVAAHGGTIRYSSNVAQGTSFYLSLPVGAPGGSSGSTTP